jgi:hypothetical protein
MIEVNLLEQVEGFYSSAWDKLITTGILVFVILAVVVPFAFYAFNFRLLGSRIKQRLDSVKIELIADIRRENRDELAQVKQDFYNKSKALKSMSLHLEANTLLKENKIEQAAANYLEAIRGYLHGKDFVNFRLLINTMIDKCLPHLNKAQLINVFKRIDTTEDDYFAELRKIDRSEYAKPEIIELRLQIELVEPAPIVRK